MTWKTVLHIYIYTIALYAVNVSLFWHNGWEQVYYSITGSKFTIRNDCAVQIERKKGTSTQHDSNTEFSLIFEINYEFENRLGLVLPKVNSTCRLQKAINATRLARGKKVAEGRTFLRHQYAVFISIKQNFTIVYITQQRKRQPRTVKHCIRTSVCRGSVIPSRVYVP